MSLTDVQVKNFKAEEKSYKKFDGNGLYLEITPAGNKLWRLKYRFKRIVDGEEKNVEDRIAFGAYPEIGLKEARDKAHEARRKIANGIDPKQEEKQSREEAIEQSRRDALTFNAVISEWLPIWKVGKSKATKKNWRRFLRPFRNAFGNKPIAQISKKDVREVLEVIIRNGKIETAKRGLWAVKEIFAHAINFEYCELDPTLYLNRIIPGTEIKHHTAITDPVKLGELLRKIENCKSGEVVKYCLRILPYLPLRSTELRGARWSEIDLENAEWMVPGTRAERKQDGGGMKNRKPHRVPLSQQVLELFKELKIYTGGSEYCFPGEKEDTCITESSLHMALKRMGYKGEMTVHGFRTVFSTLCNENKDKWQCSKDEIEYQLAHSETDQVRAAYNRAEYFDQRRRMMQLWADYLDELRERK